MRVPTQLDNPRPLRAIREGGNMINDSLYINPEQVQAGGPSGGCCMYRGSGNKWIQFTQAYRAKHGNTPLSVMAKAYKRGGGNNFVAQGLSGGANYDERGLPIASPIEPRAQPAKRAKKQKPKKEPKQYIPRMTVAQKAFARANPQMSPKDALALYRANKKAKSDERKRRRAERGALKPRYPLMDTACDYRAKAVSMGIPVSALYRDGRRTVKGKPNVLVKIPIKRDEIKALIDAKQAELRGEVNNLANHEAQFPEPQNEVIMPKRRRPRKAPMVVQNIQRQVRFPKRGMEEIELLAEAPAKKRGRRPRSAVQEPSPMMKEAIRTVAERNPESKKELMAWLKARKSKPADFGFNMPLSKLNRSELRTMFLNTGLDGSGFQQYPSNTDMDLPLRVNSTIWI